MYYVYHIGLPRDNCNLNIGYIGVTSRTLDARWEEHKKADTKIGSYIRKHKLTRESMKRIFSGTREVCFRLEAALRYKPNMGENVAEGGSFNSYAKKAMGWVPATIDFTPGKKKKAKNLSWNDKQIIYAEFKKIPNYLSKPDKKSMVRDIGKRFGISSGSIFGMYSAHNQYNNF